jgi:hypothetical protein
MSEISAEDMFPERTYVVVAVRQGFVPSRHERSEWREA